MPLYKENNPFTNFRIGLNNPSTPDVPGNELKDTDGNFMRDTDNNLLTDTEV